MWRALRTLLREPPPPRPTQPSSLDGGLALVGAALVLVEGALREGLALRGLQVLVGLGIAASLRWRRVSPLPALTVGFGLADVLTAVQVARGVALPGLASNAAVLLLPYALLHYGAWREVAAGIGVVLLTYLAAFGAGEMRGREDAIGALVVMLFPAALGAVARYRDVAHRGEVAHAQLRERQMLARELHDTVAHRMAAIVIQAQAARAVAGRRPEAAATALGAIEGEAARGLAELRSLVGALRDDAGAAPGAGDCVEAIEALVRDAGALVSFTRAGDLAGLPPAVALALQRIARESIHNARRHARGATRIEVRLAGEADAVRLTVRDDGARVDAAAGARAAFGLVGMRERATLLGGTLDAGPHPAGGWQVEAALPRDGASL
jgi:signal transduction histidine kinase